MLYRPNDIAIINSNYSQVKDKKRGRVICTSNGEIKILNCDPNILSCVFSYVDGIRTFKEIENNLSDKFYIKDIKEFLDVLLEEDILIKVEKNQEESVNDKKIVVIGDDAIFENIKKKNISYIFLKDFVKNNYVYDYDFAIFSPSKISYGDLIRINKQLYNMKKPFIPIYFDGLKIIAGPFVIPGETACLECIL